jgi:hypothetical protein
MLAKNSQIKFRVLKAPLLLIVRTFFNIEILSIAKDRGKIPGENSIPLSYGKFGDQETPKIRSLNCRIKAFFEFIYFKNNLMCK